MNKNTVVKTVAGLVVEVIGEETMIFAPRNTACGCLSPQASKILKACQSGVTIQELITAASQEGLSENDTLVALRELITLGAVDTADGVSRREFFKVTGTMAAGVALVASIALPSPAAAASAGDCVNANQCTNGVAACCGCDPSNTNSAANCASFFCGKTIQKRSATFGGGVWSGGSCTQDIANGGEVGAVFCFPIGVGQQRDCNVARTDIPSQFSYECCVCNGDFLN